MLPPVDHRDINTIAVVTRPQHSSASLTRPQHNSPTRKSRRVAPHLKARSLRTASTASEFYRRLSDRVNFKKYYGGHLFDGHSMGAHSDRYVVVNDGHISLGSGVRLDGGYETDDSKAPVLGRQPSPGPPRTSRWSSKSKSTNGRYESNESQGFNQDEKIVQFRDDDPYNPHNWGILKKWYVVFTGILTVVNSTLGSALPSNATASIVDRFGVTNQQEAVLLISVYLFGYIFGPVIFAPISEQHSRAWVTKLSFFVYTVFTMGCALAPTYAVLIVFRLFCGLAASAPIVVTGGIYADVYADAIPRGRAMVLFVAATAFGPLFAPVFSGFVAQNPAIGWRWTFWIGLAIAGGSWIPLAALPETYAPVILARRARQWRKETGDQRWVSQHEIDMRAKTFKQTITKLVAMPLKMLVTEPVVLATSLYMSLVYAIFYMFFSGAYDAVFMELYQLSPGVTGLMYIPIGGGAILAILMCLCWEAYYLEAKKLHKTWAQKPEASRVPLAFMGGPLFVIALFCQGWTARADVHWVVPMLAGIPFGMGFLLIMMALQNYLADAYEIYAASALASASMCRSVFAALLPLATPRMYRALGIGWASSLLGFCALVMCAVPCVFWFYGERLRESSPFCQELLKKKLAQSEEENEREKSESQRSSRIL